MPNYPVNKNLALGPNFNPAPDGLDDAVVYPDDVTGQPARYRRILSAKRMAQALSEIVNLNDAVFNQGGATFSVIACSEGIHPGPVTIIGIDEDTGFHIVCNSTSGESADFIATEYYTAGEQFTTGKGGLFQACPLYGGWRGVGAAVFLDTDGNPTTDASVSNGQIIGHVVSCTGDLVGTDGTEFTGTDITAAGTDISGMGCCLIRGYIACCAQAPGEDHNVVRIVYVDTDYAPAIGKIVHVVKRHPDYTGTNGVFQDVYEVINADNGETDDEVFVGEYTNMQTLGYGEVGYASRRGFIAENFSLSPSPVVGEPVYLRQTGGIDTGDPSEPTFLGQAMRQRVGWVCRLRGGNHADVLFDIVEPDRISNSMIVDDAVGVSQNGPESTGPRNIRYGGWHDNLLNSAHSITTGYDQEGANYATTQWRTFDNSLFSTSRVLTVGSAASGWEFTVTVEVAQFLDVFFPIGGQKLLYGGVANDYATSNVIGASITFHFGSLGWTVKSCSNPADWTIHS